MTPPVHLHQTHQPTAADLDMLLAAQRDAFDYFLRETHPRTGLVADKSRPGWPASIAATGMGLACQTVAVERGYQPREAAARQVLTALSFLWNSPQGPEPNVTGYKGFFYHFLDPETGRRAFQSELSTVDTAFLLAGALVVAAYFDQDDETESQIRRRVDDLYRRVEWTWALNGAASLVHGWLPESGFLGYRWEGYDEALLLYVLALGSPTYALPPESYPAYMATCFWKKVYDFELYFAGPLFIHQYPQMFLDLRGLQDEYIRRFDSDYFENSRRATLVQREYAIRNPLEFEGYGRDCWGLTASDGPGPATMKLNGIVRIFYEYVARGAPFGPDDGTIAPWAVVASLPFAPEIVLPAIRHFAELKLHEPPPYGYKASYNPTFPVESSGLPGWVSRYHFGINQAPIVLMTENYLTELIWRLTQRCPYVVDGLRRAKFSGGWLE